MSRDILYADIVAGRMDKSGAKGSALATVLFVMKDDNLAVTASQLLRNGEAAVLRAVVENDNLEFQII